MKKFQANVKSVFDSESRAIIEKKIDSDKILYLEVSSITPGPYQARELFDESSLAGLRDSIKENGILNPITVKLVSTGVYELVAGERRLRASKLAGLSHIPAIVTNISSEQMMILGLIENIQRDQLNPMEEAKAFHRLIKEFRLTHDEVSRKVGKPRSTISNFLRLLNLENKVQSLLQEGLLSFGHAKLLTSFDPKEQIFYANEAITRRMTVRGLEHVIRSKNKKTIKKQDFLSNLNLRHGKDLEYEDVLSKLFNINVDVKCEGDEYSVRFTFNSEKSLKKFIKKYHKSFVTDDD